MLSASMSVSGASSPLSAALEDRWRQDGWCVIEDAIPAAALAGAQDALARLFPTPTQMEGGDDDEITAPWRTWDAAWPEFPFHSARLNGLVVHEVVLGIAERLLGTPDPRLYLAIVTAKYAHQSSGFNQLLHADYPNHTLVVPRRDEAFQHVELLVYLSDVSVENGATRFVSRRSTSAVPVEEHTLDLDRHALIYAEARDATAAAGSIVAYRPDVYHQSVDMCEPGRARFLMHLAFRPAGLEWAGYQSWPFKGFSPAWHKFVNASTPRQLVALGFPPPGHPYWTAETLDGVAARYPGLDMTPWRRGADPGEGSALTAGLEPDGGARPAAS
jgi:hypothetical protein